MTTFSLNLFQHTDFILFLAEGKSWFKVGIFCIWKALDIAGGGIAPPIIGGGGGPPIIGGGGGAPIIGGGGGGPPIIGGGGGGPPIIGGGGGIGEPIIGGGGGIWEPHIIGGSGGGGGGGGTWEPPIIGGSGGGGGGALFFIFSAIILDVNSTPIVDGDPLGKKGGGGGGACDPLTFAGTRWFFGDSDWVPANSVWVELEIVGMAIRDRKSSFRWDSSSVKINGVDVEETLAKFVVVLVESRRVCSLCNSLLLPEIITFWTLFSINCHICGLQERLRYL